MSRYMTLYVSLHQPIINTCTQIRFLKSQLAFFPSPSPLNSSIPHPAPLLIKDPATHFIVLPVVSIKARRSLPTPRSASVCTEQLIKYNSDFSFFRKWY